MSKGNDWWMIVRCIWTGPAGYQCPSCGVYVALPKRDLAPTCSGHIGRNRCATQFVSDGASQRTMEEFAAAHMMEQNAPWECTCGRQSASWKNHEAHLQGEWLEVLGLGHESPSDD